MAGAMLLPRKLQEQRRRGCCRHWQKTNDGSLDGHELLLGRGRNRLEGATVSCWFSRHMQSLCIFIGDGMVAARLFENKTPTGKISRPIKISVVTACDFDWSRDFLALK